MVVMEQICEGDSALLNTSLEGERYEEETTTIFLRSPNCLSSKGLQQDPNGVPHAKRFADGASGGPDMSSFDLLCWSIL